MEKKKISRRTVRKIQVVVATVMLTVCVLTTTAFAVTADSAWTSVMGLIWKWVPKIGAAICAVGLIEFALGFKSEDADGKTRGLRTAAAGAMVIGAAVVGASLTGGTAETGSGTSSDSGTEDSASTYVQTVDEINL